MRGTQGFNEARLFDVSMLLHVCLYLSDGLVTRRLILLHGYVHFFSLSPLVSPSLTHNLLGVTKRSKLLVLNALHCLFHLTLSNFCSFFLSYSLCVSNKRMSPYILTSARKHISAHALKEQPVIVLMSGLASVSCNHNYRVCQH